MPTRAYEAAGMSSFVVRPIIFSDDRTASRAASGSTPTGGLDGFGKPSVADPRENDELVAQMDEFERRKIGLSL